MEQQRPKKTDNPVFSENSKSPAANSSFELPDGVGFKSNNIVYLIEDPKQEWGVFAYTSEGKVNLMGKNGPLYVSIENLKLHFAIKPGESMDGTDGLEWDPNKPKPLMVDKVRKEVL